MRMDAAHVEADHAVVGCRIIRPDDAHEIQSGQAAHALGDERLLASLHGFEADFLDVSQRSVERVNAGRVLRSSFEFLGHGRPRGILFGDRFDHLAAR